MFIITLLTQTVINLHRYYQYCLHYVTETLSTSIIAYGPFIQANPMCLIVMLTYLVGRLTNWFHCDQKKRKIYSVIISPDLKTGTLFSSHICIETREVIDRSTNCSLSVDRLVDRGAFSYPYSKEGCFYPNHIVLYLSAKLHSMLNKCTRDFLSGCFMFLIKFNLMYVFVFRCAMTLWQTEARVDCSL